MTDWANRTSEERKEFSRTMSKVHYNKTTEEQEDWNNRVAESLRKTWTLKPLKEKEEFSKMVSNTWTKRTTKEREEISRKISESVRKSIKNKSPEKEEERRKKVSEASIRNWASKPSEEKEELRRRQSKTQIEVWKRLSQNERDTWIRNALTGQKRKPSMPESLLNTYLASNFPGEWIYNGDCSQGVVIGRKTPDFISSTGRKEVIEVLGALGFFHFWDDEDLKIAHYKSYGLKCTIIWEWDCYLINELDKIFKTNKEANIAV